MSIAPLCVLICIIKHSYCFIVAVLADSDVSDTTGVHVSPVDCVIVLSFFALWVFAICLFVRQWHRLRLIKPRNHGLKQKPKNLDSVKVVKRCSDSVIYSSYPLAMTRTMAAREKRLARMQTMPAIKVDPDAKSPAKKLKRDLEMPYSLALPSTFVRSLTLPSHCEDSEAPPSETHPMLTVNTKL